MSDEPISGREYLARQEAKRLSDLLDHYRATVTARSAFWSLAMLGHAVTVGVLADHAAWTTGVPVQVVHGVGVADTRRVLRAALGDS